VHLTSNQSQQQGVSKFNNLVYFTQCGKLCHSFVDVWKVREDLLVVTIRPSYVNAYKLSPNKPLLSLTLLG
jgi:hypothetical protein